MKPENGKITVHIPEGADLNDPDLHEDKTQSIPFDDLPSVLADTCTGILTDDTEREVYLLSALGVISGILPNVRGFYHSGYVEANLFVFIEGIYGGGKGAIRYARQLANAIHLDRIEQAEQALIDYKREMKEYKDGNRSDEPRKPGSWRTFIPVNITKTGIQVLIHENGGRGILFETEADTLATAVEQTHGGFTDVLRKAFHHEPISFYRNTDRIDVHIERPFLSVVLSGTFDQLQKLIPTIENGLFSRFIFYCLEPDTDFDDVFAPHRRHYPEHFERLGETFKGWYDYLSTRTDPVAFRLTDGQQARFLIAFQLWKMEMTEMLDIDLAGTVNRLGLIAYRIAMILTTIRQLAERNGSLPDEMECDDTDFDTAMKLADLIRKNALNVYYRLPRPDSSPDYTEFEKELTEKADLVALARKYRADGKSYGDIAEQLLDDRKLRGTVYRWLNYNGKKKK